MIPVITFRKKTSSSSKRWTLDKLFRQFVRERDVTCQAAGLWGVECMGELQVAHFHPRRHLSVRWDPDNAALLCELGHHRYADEHQDTKWFWIAARLGSERFAELSERRRQPWHGGYDRMKAEVLSLLNGRPD
jgi:hypothetical protein